MGQTTQPQVAIIDAEAHGQPTVLRMSGEIDLAAAPRLDTAFHELADFPRAEVIVDASLVTFMDTAGGRALILGKARVHKAGSRIVLITSPLVRRLLEIAFPGPLFAARVETMEQAREALRSAQYIQGCACTRIPTVGSQSRSF